MNQQHSPSPQDPQSGSAKHDASAVDKLLNDPGVVYNPYAQYGVQMSWFQKQKLRRQIRLQTQSKSWFQDKYQAVLVQRNVLALLSVLALLATVASVYAVESLTPLKSVEPFIIQIEERSGITQLVEPVDRSELENTEALDNYFLWQYVRARETYHPADQRENWNIVRVMSSPSVFDGYLRAISPNNPESGRAVLGSAGTRTLSNPTVTYIDDDERNLAQVRFSVKETFKNTTTRYPKLATIEYEYVTLELTREERLVNPLGFQATSYRVDEEAVR